MLKIRCKSRLTIQMVSRIKFFKWILQSSIHEHRQYGI